MMKIEYLQKKGDIIMETVFATTPKWPTIKSGNKGANVSALQCLLNYHGASISVDGNFGLATALRRRFPAISQNIIWILME